MINKPLIWVLWGMWPYASLRAYELILNESIKYSKWNRNNDFPHIIIDNIPVKELTNSEESLKETIFYVKNEYKRLKNNGVNIFIMACNTMHLYYDKIFEEEDDIINLSLISETISQIKQDLYKTVGILWTVNTVKSWLYLKILEKEWILWINIDDENILYDINNIIKKIIWWVKILDDNDSNTLRKSITILQKKWAESIILWCTELPIAFNQLNVDIKLYDPLLITIKKSCEIYYNILK